MKRLTVLLVCAVFAAGAVICGASFAQRSVNTAEDAAKAAKASLMNKPRGASSQIEWLNQVVNMINMDESSPKDGSDGEKKSGE